MNSKAEEISIFFKLKKKTTWKKKRDVNEKYIKNKSAIATVTEKF